MLLDALGQRAVLHAGMCLGEGTGAVALFPVLDLGLAVYEQMSSFPILRWTRIPILKRRKCCARIHSGWRCQRQVGLGGIAGHGAGEAENAILLPWNLLEKRRKSAFNITGMPGERKGFKRQKFIPEWRTASVRSVVTPLCWNV